MKYMQICLRETLLFLYVLSVIIFSYSAEYYQLSNLVGFTLVTTYLIEKFVKDKDLLLGVTVFHAIFFIFIIICTSSLLIEISGYKRVYTIYQLFILSIIVADIIVDRRSIWPIKFSIIIGGIYACLIVPKQLAMLSYGEEVPRIGSTLGNPNVFSLTLILGIIFLFHNLLFPTKRWPKISKALSVILILFFSFNIIFYTGSRKGMFLLLALSLIYSIYAFKNTRIRGKVCLLFAFPSLQLFLFFTIIRSEHFNRFRNFFLLATGGTVSEGSINTRIGMVYRSIQLWNKKPIFGWGIDQYKNISGFGKYSHNNYSEILVNNGLIGFLTYYLLFVLLIFSSLYIYKNKSQNVGFWLFSILILLIINDFGAVSYYSKLYWIALSTIFGVIKLQQKNENAVSSSSQNSDDLKVA